MKYELKMNTLTTQCTKLSFIEKFQEKVTEKSILWLKGVDIGQQGTGQVLLGFCKKEWSEWKRES